MKLLWAATASIDRTCGGFNRSKYMETCHMQDGANI